MFQLLIFALHVSAHTMKSPQRRTRAAAQCRQEVRIARRLRTEARRRHRVAVEEGVDLTQHIFNARQVHGRA